MADILTPFVYWAQTKQQITLKVNLTHAWHVKVHMNENKLRVTIYGQGARGLSEYGFSLDLHSSINVEESNYKVTPRQVNFTLGKKCPAWWPRLTSQPQKPSWLKIDFDKWTSKDSDDNEDERRDVCSDYPDMYDKLHEEGFGYGRENIRKLCLITYNIGQFVGFIYILTVMGIMFLRGGPESMKETHMVVGWIMKHVRNMQFLEISNSLFGYAGSSPFATAIQVLSRAFVLFVMIKTEPRIQMESVAFYLFLVWSIVELFRCPNYITTLFKVEISFLRRERYTIWLPVGALGFLCEGTIISSNIPYFEETHNFNVSLPNSWNFAFHFPSFLNMYLILFSAFCTYILMSYMNKITHKKLDKSRLKKSMRDVKHDKIKKLKY